MPRAKNGQRRGIRAKVSETVLLTGIKQGAGGTVGRSFGSRPMKRQRKGRKNGNGCSRRGNVDVWDAFHPAHLPLPRAVAPYTVIRTTAVWNPATEERRRFNLFGPIMRAGSGQDGGRWSSAFCMGSNKEMTDLMSATDGWHRYCFSPMHTASWQAASVTPAAFSIQVLNPSALQGTNGMLYIGRCKNKVNVSEGPISDDFRTLADSLISFSNPRMCSAAKLALRGVQVDAVPNNMSELAKFTTLEQSSDEDVTMASSNTYHGEGFNPIFIDNPSAVEIQVLVCCEWRVRFDPSNPAYAANVAHKPSTDTDWWHTMEKALVRGHGVVDLLDRVAAYGQPIASALAGM